ncbi:MAG: DHH family phosphoesterase [Bacteroidia bacterium]
MGAKVIKNQSFISVSINIYTFAISMIKSDSEQFSQKDIQPVKELLSSKKNIVITTHHKPDGDAMGSSLGLFHYLKLKGHNCTVITPNEYPDFLSWLPGNKEVINFEKHKDQSLQKMKEAEILFCLDFNRPDRTLDMEKEINNSSAVKILIDHHLDPSDFADYSFCYHTSAATAELIYKFIVALGDKKLLNKEISECLYTGIMTDTGSFRFSSVTANIHRIIADLIDAGAVNYMIHERVYDDSTEQRLRLLGFCIKDKMEVLYEYNTAIIALSNEDLKKYSHKDGDTEGIVNFPLSIRNIILSAFFTETDGIVKISLRSQGEFSAKEIVKEHFNGGGHRNAAGGKSETSLVDAVKKFKEILPQYQKELLSII